MRQTNKEDRFSCTKPNRRERERERSAVVWSTLSTYVLPSFFFLSFVVVYIDFLFLLLSVYMCVCVCVEYRKKVVPRNIDQKNRSVRHFFPSYCRYYCSVIDAEKDGANIFICRWIYTHPYIYTKDKSSTLRRKKISNNNILPQSLTYIPPPQDNFFLLHYKEKRLRKKEKKTNSSILLMISMNIDEQQGG